MKYLQAIVIITMLIFSKRYREDLSRATEQLAEAHDAIVAEFRRMDADRNGGKPRIHLLHF